MAIDLKRFQALQSRVEELQREQIRAEGALDQLKSQLKKEFGCDTIKAGKSLLAKLEHDEQLAVDQFNKALDEFEFQFGDVLK